MKRALIVDDLPDNLLLLRRWLEHEGWTVDEALDGAAAFSQARHVPPDIIVSDLLMPVMDGYTLLKHCKSDDRLRSVPFVIFTATYTTAQDEAFALNLGADAFVLKTVSEEELMARIEEVRRRARAGGTAIVVPPTDDVVVLRQYNEVLVRKLEEKNIELQEVARRAQLGEERLRLALEAGGIGLFDWNLVTGDLIWSEDQMNLVGLTAAEFDGRYETFRRLVHPDDLSQVEAGLQLAQERREGYRDEYRILRRDGSTRWIAVSGKFIYDAQGRPWRMNGVVRDISARKVAEIALEEAVEFNRQIISSAQEGIVAFDRELRYVLYNPFMERLRGLRAVDVIGKRPGEMLPANYAEEIDERNRRALAGETVSVSELLASPSPSGEDVWLSLIASPLRDAAGNIAGVLTMLRDVTELKRANDAVRENEERLRQVTENIGEVFWLTDLTKRKLIYISPAYEKIWGRSCASLMAAPESWLDAVHPDDRERVRTAAHTQQESGIYNVDYRILRPDGSTRWVHDRAFPIRDANGQVYRVAGVAEDVTTARLLEERYRQAQKMEAVGQLAGGIAHDFNNLLTVIQMHGSLLQAQRNRGVAEALQPIMDAAERAANLTRQLLTFSRRQVKDSRPIDLVKVVDATVQMLRRVLAENIALETRFAPDGPLVNADPGMMEQVLMNLAVNARDAMPQGGRLTIEIDTVTVTENHAASHPLARSGRFVRLTVGDTGVGIPAQHLTHIFDPFFTTKEVGKGTGLGLATVFSIVEQHAGWIEVESVVGRGTAFRVFLPVLAEETKLEPVQAPPARVVRGGSETILLVEDEAPVRRVTQLALRALGYQVIEAGSAEEAMQRWRRSHRKIKLLLTDLIMPGGVTGHELADKLREVDPALRVVYMSGYSDEVVNRTVKVEPGTDFLLKPFEADDLAVIVRQALDAPPRDGRAAE